MIRFIIANWIWFALIGAMLLMHRGHMGHGGAGGGCGGHGSHGGDRHSKDAAGNRTPEPVETTNGRGGPVASAGGDGRRHRGC